MAFLDPGALLLIEIGIASAGALIGLWFLKRRTDKKGIESQAG